MLPRMARIFAHFHERIKMWEFWKIISMWNAQTTWNAQIKHQKMPS